LRAPVTRRHRIETGAAAVLIAVTLAACGSGDNESSGASDVAAWADGLCGSLVTWKDSSKAAGNKLTEGQISRAKLDEMGEEIRSADETLRDDLQELGKPPTPAATEAKAAAEGLAAELKENYEKIEEAVSGVSGANEFLAAVSVVGASVSAMADDVAATAQALKSLRGQDEWKEAFSDSEACGKLTSG
jgi:hypothetical protein